MESTGSAVRVVRVGLLGAGTVGGGVWTILRDHADSIAARTGARVEVTRVGVRDRSRRRSVTIPADLLTDDPMAVVEAEDVDLVVEVMGGGRRPVHSSAVPSSSASPS